MILADSAVWIDHLRRPEPGLVALLAADQIVGHPFVTGKVSLGSIATRARVIAKLNALPQLRTASPERVAMLVESAALWGLGIGYVDVHLLASALLTPDTSFWTRDKRLRAVAARMGIAADLD